MAVQQQEHSMVGRKHVGISAAAGGINGKENRSRSLATNGNLLWTQLSKRLMTLRLGDRALDCQSGVLGSLLVSVTSLLSELR